VVPRGGTFDLPFGPLAVDMDAESLHVGERTLYHFVPVAELEVTGLAMRYRRPGLGSPLAAATLPADAASPARDFVAPGLRVPVTLLLRIPDARRTLVEGKSLRATLELYLAAEPETVAIDGERVPLEVEPTAALALSLSELPITELEFEDFL